jgi:hypothetical protein
MQCCEFSSSHSVSRECFFLEITRHFSITLDSPTRVHHCLNGAAVGDESCTAAILEPLAATEVGDDDFEG